MNSFFSPGKLVLCGEHAVVYGEPAVVGTINLGVSARVKAKAGRRKPFLELVIETVEKELGIAGDPLDLEVGGDLPQKRGLGSSTAVAAAGIKALADWFEVKLSKKRLFELVMTVERKTYPTVSGMDQTAIVYGGLYRFQKNEGKYQHEGIKSRALNNRKFLLVDSGMAVESTGEMVGLVREKKEIETIKINKIIKDIGKITEELVKSLNMERFEPGLLRENERLLEELGVVGERAQTMIREIEKIGGVAKISGAGGVKEGSGVLICIHKDEEKLVDLIRRRKWRYWRVNLM